MSTQATASDTRSGWVTFAGILLFAVGFFRIISAISYFANSHRVNDFTNGAFNGHLWAYGVWDLCVAALALGAAISLLGGGAFGRLIAYIWAIFVIVQGFLTIGQAPWYSAAMITLSVLVIHGLSSTAGKDQWS